MSAETIQAPYAVKAFREDGTPTITPRRYYETREAAVADAEEVAAAMGKGWVQLEKFNFDRGWYEFTECFEARGPKITRRF